MFAVVLVHPEIPPNTGNVIRLTANTGAELHLVEPLGFRIDDRDLKRAGLDYHEYARVVVHADFAACRAALDATAAAGAGSRSRRRRRESLYDVALRAGRRARVRLRDARTARRDRSTRSRRTHRLRLPMRPGVRSLNLSNAVAVAVYEAWRQNGFAGAGEARPG